VAMSVTDTLRSFLREVLDTPLKQELLAFFVTNRAMDTAHGLSVWLGRPADEIRAAADSLVQAGLLRKEGEAKTQSTVTNRDPKLLIWLMPSCTFTKRRGLNCSKNCFKPASRLSKRGSN